MSLEKIIEGKNILLVPIISMRSYETGKYNLMADGNISRIISKLASSKFKKATILIPANNQGLEELNILVNKVIGKEKINFIECDAYGENAGQTRKEINKFMPYLEDSSQYDIILIEPNMLTYELIKHKNKIVDKLIFWCPVSATTGFTPKFINEYSLIDKYISEHIPVAVATKSQKDFLKGKSFIDENFYDASYFDYATIYFPFRLSDPCYHAEEFKKVVINLKNKGYNFRVLYSDPNESGIFDDSDIFVKVPPQKEVYTQILKSRPIIPYLENSNDVLHISIFEFLHYRCDIIQFKNDNITSIYCTDIESINELEKALKNKIEKYWRRVK